MPLRLSSAAPRTTAVSTEAGTRSSQAVIAALKDAKIDVTGVTLSDGSGLSRD